MLVTDTEYDAAGAVEETTKLPVTWPDASTKQAGEENKVEGMDESVHGPTSSGANGTTSVTVTGVLAGPVIGAKKRVGTGLTVNAVSANSAVAVSVTLTVNVPGTAVLETAKAAVTDPSAAIVQVVPGLVAYKAPVGDCKVQPRAPGVVLNPPPETCTLPDPSVGRVPNPGEAANGETTIVGVLTIVNPVAVWSTPGCPVTVTTCGPEMVPTRNDVPEASWPLVLSEHV
jgi:hypothetical protein